MRIRDRAQLMKATQELALEKWNAHPGRPRWDRDGLMLRHVAPRPVDLDSRYYLTDDARSVLRAWAKRWARYRGA